MPPFARPRLRLCHLAAHAAAWPHLLTLVPLALPVLQTNEIRNGRLAMIACLGMFGQAVMTTEGPFKNLLDHLVRRGLAASGRPFVMAAQGENLARRCSGGGDNVEGADVYAAGCAAS